MCFILEFKDYKVCSLIVVVYSYRVQLMDYCLSSPERVVT